MEITRRDFLKVSGMGVGGAFLLGAIDPAKTSASPVKALPLKKKLGEITSICPYCGVGCGFVITSENGKVTNVEGDPEHPVNMGAACAKGAALRQMGADNPWRLSKVLYRAPNSAEYEEKSWDWAIPEIAKRIKKTRDSSFVEKDAKGNTVNRTEAIANLGGAALDNEECYLLSKMTRALGLVYIEHQARI
jgi:formate dehydrogenase major subunit